MVVGPRGAARREKTASKHVMAICTDVTQKRLATEGIKKEQQLLRRLLDMHEHERQLIAYDIHDGFAQQLAGACSGCKASARRSPATRPRRGRASIRPRNSLCRAIDETRRLISGLRPPVLDEFGVVEAVQYLVYEHRRHGGPEIEFDHDMAGERLAPPLENAIFRIVQESLNNACRHSRSDRIHVSLDCNATTAFASTFATGESASTRTPSKSNDSDCRASASASGCWTAAWPSNRRRPGNPHLRGTAV